MSAAVRWGWRSAGTGRGRASFPSRITRASVRSSRTHFSSPGVPPRGRTLPARRVSPLASCLGWRQLWASKAPPPHPFPPSKAPSFGSVTLCMSPWAVERWVTPAPPATSRASPRGSRARLAKHKLWDAPRFPLPYGTGGSADAMRFRAAARAVHGAEGAAGRGRLQRRSCSPRAPVNQQLCVRSGGEKHPAGSTLPVPVPGCS